jgi:hypothetical protein
MPFPQQNPIAFTQQGIESLNPDQYGCYGIFNSIRWIYVGKGDIRSRLLAHLNASPLGGHLKTGHTWTLQNRPTEQNQNNNIYTLPEVARANNFPNAELILISPGRRIRQRRDATGAPIQRPEWGAADSRPSRLFWLESGKSQGVGDRVPKVKQCFLALLKFPTIRRFAWLNARGALVATTLRSQVGHLPCRTRAT